MAQTHFAGGTPGFAGLYQINATIPLDVPAGTNVPLAIVTGNAFHDQVDIPIQGQANALRGEAPAPARKLNTPVPPRARIR